MKFQPRRFVVEVKRGTSRQAFASQDDASARFGSAEAALFGGSAETVAKKPAETPVAASKPTGRILMALDVPEPIVAPDPEPPRRRGRPPGSKNRPKPVDTLTGQAAAIEALVRPAPELPREPPPAAAPVSRPAVSEPTGPARSRLRDRSRILRRYVLGIEPRAGKRLPFRARRIGSKAAE